MIFGIDGANESTSFSKIPGRSTGPAPGVNSVADVMIAFIFASVSIVSSFLKRSMPKAFNSATCSSIVLGGAFGPDGATSECIILIISICRAMTTFGSSGAGADGRCVNAVIMAVIIVIIICIIWLLPFAFSPFPAINALAIAENCTFGSTGFGMIFCTAFSILPNAPNCSFAASIGSTFPVWIFAAASSASPASTITSIAGYLFFSRMPPFFHTTKR